MDAVPSEADAGRPLVWHMIATRFRGLGRLALLTLVFTVTVSSIPLPAAIQFGADEGLELAKGVLVLQGRTLYTEVWNDQPPLHTWLVSWVLKHVSNSVAGPRIMTMAFAGVLGGSLALMASRGGRAGVGWLAGGLLVCSPGFIELGSSCMLEIPALAMAVAGLAILARAGPGTGQRLEDHGSEPPLPCRTLGIAAAGMVFGAALQTKLTAALVLPAVGVAWWLAVRQGPRPWRAWAHGALWFGGGLAASFAAIHLAIGDNAYFRQLWGSHFARAQSFEYGSAGDHPFDWLALVKNWDLTLPALAGGVLAFRPRYREGCLIPAVWLAVALAVFAIHRPWWSYYYVHLAIPMAWLAAVALREGWEGLDFRKHRALAGWFCLLALGMAGWMGARVYLQVAGMRQLPKIHSSLAIAELKRYRPYVTTMYAEQPVYSFHAGIPMPPNLAVLPLKRFWSGEVTNAKLEAALRAARPGLIMLANDGRPTPLEDLVNAHYRLVYQDQNHRLYAVPEAAARVAREQATGSPERAWVLPRALPSN